MRSWLLEGEQVIVASRPQARSLIWSAVLVVLIPTLLGLMGAWLSRARWTPEWDFWRFPIFLLTLAAGVLLMIFVSLRRYLRWLTTWYLLTSSRVVVRSGWFRRGSQDFALGAVRSVVVRQGVLQRVLRSGDLLITSGFENTARIPDVPEVMTFRALLAQAVDRLPHADRGSGVSYGYREAESTDGRR